MEAKIGFSYAKTEAMLRGEAAYCSENAEFSDPVFPPNATSLYRNGHSATFGLPYSMVLFPRVHLNQVKDCADPVLFDQVPGTIVSGSLPNNWFLSALTVLTMKMELVKDIIVSSEQAENGLYTVRFFINDEWQYVHIDDAIACSTFGAFCYAKSSHCNEIWVSLIEKGYAKLMGCYEDYCIEGNTTTALRDLSGGISFIVNVYDEALVQVFDNDALWQLIFDVRLECVLGCYHQGQHVLCGFRPSTVYGIVELYDFSHLFKDTKIQLVKIRRFHDIIRNIEHEWHPTSVRWTEYPCLLDELPALLENELYLSWSEFCRYFSHIIVCRPEKPKSIENGESIESPESSVKWHTIQGHFDQESHLYGQSGSLDSPTFAESPQYSFTCSDDATIWIELAQTSRSVGHLYPSPQDHNIGWTLVQVSNPESKRVETVLTTQHIYSTGMTTQYASGYSKLQSGKRYILLLFIQPNLHHILKIPYTLRYQSSVPIEMSLSTKNYDKLDEQTLRKTTSSKNTLQHTISVSMPNEEPGIACKILRQHLTFFHEQQFNS